ncbi:unnamed protein product, partial [Didymodactylos carnosus]
RGPGHRLAPGQPHGCRHRRRGRCGHRRCQPGVGAAQRPWTGGDDPSAALDAALPSAALGHGPIDDAQNVAGAARRPAGSLRRPGAGTCPKR